MANGNGGAPDPEPEKCPHGHWLAWPNARVGWAPCRCARALFKPSGHRTVGCLTCRWQWREGGCDEKGEWHDLLEGQPAPHGWYNQQYGRQADTGPDGH